MTCSAAIPEARHASYTAALGRAAGLIQTLPKKGLSSAAAIQVSSCQSENQGVGLVWGYGPAAIFSLDFDRRQLMARSAPPSSFSAMERSSRRLGGIGLAAIIFRLVSRSLPPRSLTPIVLLRSPVSSAVAGRRGSAARIFLDADVLTGRCHRAHPIVFFEMERFLAARG